MTSKTVTRYQCGFCKKKGYSASHMAKHERHCTMNPNRVCRVCRMITGEVQPRRPVKELVAILPKHPRSYYEGAQDEDGTIFPHPNAESEVANALVELRKAYNDCPACIMAALRQAGIPVHCAKGFDFKKEMQSIWDDINNAKLESCGHGY